MSRRFSYRGQEIELDVERDDDRVRLSVVDGVDATFEVRRVGSAEFIVRDPDDEGTLHTVHAVRDGNHWWINLDGRTVHLEQVIARGGAGGARGGLVAPIPATVQEVLVTDGDAVEEGQVVLVLTAMKMQIEIKAPHAGIVKGLTLAAGDKVDGGVPLLEIEADA